MTSYPGYPGGWPDVDAIAGSPQAPTPVDLATVAPPDQQGQQPAPQPQLRNPLLGALGMDPADPRGNRIARASLGAGLSGVANNWSKPAMAAFAGGAGASLQGGAAAEQQDTVNAQHQQQLQTQRLGELIKAYQVGDMAAYRQKYLEIMGQARYGQSVSGGAGAPLPPGPAASGQGAAAGPAAPFAGPPPLPATARTIPSGAPVPFATIAGAPPRFSATANTAFDQQFAGAPNMLAPAAPATRPAAAGMPPPSGGAAGAASPQSYPKERPYRFRGATAEDHVREFLDLPDGSYFTNADGQRLMVNQRMKENVRKAYGIRAPSASAVAPDPALDPADPQ